MDQVLEEEVPLHHPPRDVLLDFDETLGHFPREIAFLQTLAHALDERQPQMDPVQKREILREAALRLADLDPRPGIVDFLKDLANLKKAKLVPSVRIMTRATKAQEKSWKAAAARSDAKQLKRELSQLIEDETESNLLSWWEKKDNKTKAQTTNFSQRPISSWLFTETPGNNPTTFLYPPYTRLSKKKWDETFP